MSSSKRVKRACAVVLVCAGGVAELGAAPPAEPTQSGTPALVAPAVRPLVEKIGRSVPTVLPPSDGEWQERAGRYGGYEWVTRPSRDVALGFTLSLEVQEILVKPGQAVKTGQKLIRARDGEILAGLRVQEFKAANDTEVRNSQAALELAQSRFDAVDKVMKKDAGTTAEYEERRLNLESAKIGVEAAQSKLREEVLRLDQAREQAKRYGIEAPFDGVVDQLVAEVGQAVTERDPILRVVDIDPLWMDVPTPTNVTIGEKLGPGHEAWALLDLPGEPVILKGKVLYVSSIVEISATRRVRIEVDNPELWPAGTRARVRFDVPGSEWTAFIRKASAPVASDGEAGAVAQSGGEKK